MTDLSCPKCKGTRFKVLSQTISRRRNWLGLWRWIWQDGVLGCEQCRAVWQITTTGAMALLEPPPDKPEARKEKDDVRPKEQIPQEVSRVQV